MKRNILLSLLILLLAFVACERYIESRDPISSLPDNVPVPQDVTVLINDQSIQLSWDISDASGISRYRIYASEEESSGFSLVDSTTGTAINISNLTLNQVYYFEIAAVNNEGLEGNRSSQVTAQIGIFNMSIESNRDVTNQQSVQVRFTVSNTPSYLIISEDSTFADAVFEQFTAQKSFTLSDGDGLKNLYARVQFANGAESGDLLHDDIILDTRALIDSVFFNPSGITFQPGDTIIFGLDAKESNGTARVSFSGSGTINLVDDGTEKDPIADDGIYYGWYLVPVNTNIYNGEVSGSFTDEAGNSASGATSFELLNINTTPEPVELIVTFESGNPAIFNWTQSNESDFESYRLYRDTEASVLPIDTLIHYETGIGVRTFEYTPPTGITYYRLVVFDVHGDYSLSNVVRVDNP